MSFEIIREIPNEIKWDSTIASLGKIYPMTHDLELLMRILRMGGTDTSLFDELSDYSLFAVLLRYASIGPSTPPLDRGKALDQVEELLAVVRRLTNAQELLSDNFNATQRPLRRDKQAQP